MEDKYIHVPVSAEVLNPETNEKSVTNVFHYTFLSPSATPPPAISPDTYLGTVNLKTYKIITETWHQSELCSMRNYILIVAEAMKFLDARRHFNVMKT